MYLTQETQTKLRQHFRRDSDTKTNDDKCGHFSQNLSHTTNYQA